MQQTPGVHVIGFRVSACIGSYGGIREYVGIDGDMQGLGYFWVHGILVPDKFSEWSWKHMILHDHCLFIWTLIRHPEIESIPVQRGVHPIGSQTGCSDNFASQHPAMNLAAAIYPKLEPQFEALAKTVHKSPTRFPLPRFHAAITPQNSVSEKGGFLKKGWP